MADSTRQEKARERSKSRLIKYMGASDFRIVLANDNFGGQLASAVGKRAEWNPSNSHVADLAELGWSDDAVDLLLELEIPGYGKEFVDVTGLDLVPVGLHQILWHGQRPRAKVAVGAQLPSQDTDLTVAGRPASGAPSAVPDPATSTGGATTTTTG